MEFLGQAGPNKIICEMVGPEFVFIKDPFFNITTHLAFHYQGPFF